MALLYTSLRTVDVKEKKNRTIDVASWRFESEVQRGGCEYKLGVVCILKVNEDTSEDDSV